MRKSSTAKDVRFPPRPHFRYEYEKIVRDAERRLGVQRRHYRDRLDATDVILCSARLRLVPGVHTFNSKMVAKIKHKNNKKLNKK